MNLGTAKITEIKANALLALDKFLTKRLNSNDEKSIKIVQTISYWILDYVKFLTYESNNNMKFKRYKRGDVIQSKFWSPHRSRTRWASLCHSFRC